MATERPSADSIAFAGEESHGSSQETEGQSWKRTGYYDNLDALLCRAHGRAHLALPCTGVTRAQVVNGQGHRVPHDGLRAGVDCLHDYALRPVCLHRQAFTKPQHLRLIVISRDVAHEGH